VVTKTCLLITEQFEPTADVLVAELRRRNVPCVRWNLDRYPLGSALTCRAANEAFTAEIVTDGRKVDLDNVASIWCRHFRPRGLPDDIGTAERVFAETEAQRTLDALLTIKDVLWVNHPHRYTIANAKAAQLFTARRLGLEIPPTLITNDPHEARSFLAKAEGAVVYKAMSQSLEMQPGKALFTGVVTENESANLDLIRLTPGIFQQFVPKAYELRITVVGTRVFSAKIDSQVHAETKIDWRHIPLDLDHQAIPPPPEIAAKIHEFMQSFGLIYGAFDFIVTPEGRHVFLEVNPAGQYMWVEAKTGLEITAALADVLSAPCQA
jgi:glutathione synthase/RimK-type ligase-like ATP-grasp enzyme